MSKKAISIPLYMETDSVVELTGSTNSTHCHVCGHHPEMREEQDNFTRGLPLLQNIYCFHANPVLASLLQVLGWDGLGQFPIHSTWLYGTGC